MSYAPSLIVEENIKISKTRALPLLGRALVHVGDKVRAESPVLAAELPGELIVIRIADKLGVEPSRLKEVLNVAEGDIVKKGELIARHSSLFGWIKDEIYCPTDGTIEYIIESTGYLGLRLPPKSIEIDAYISGEVISVRAGSSVTIKTDGSLIQGIFGVGGERIGRVLYLKGYREKEISVGSLEQLDLAGKIVCGGRTFSREAINFAASRGAIGIFTGSVTSEVLEQFTGSSLGISMTGDEKLPLSFVISEGFGSLPISERIEQILLQVEGREASFNGATQVRAGAIRPELIITNSKLGASGVQREPNFELGRKVRCLRAPYFGELGEISSLPSSPRQIASGAVVRVALVRFKSGQTHLVPRANLEIID